MQGALNALNNLVLKKNYSEDRSLVTRFIQIAYKMEHRDCPDAFCEKMKNFMSINELKFFRATVQLLQQKGYSETKAPALNMRIAESILPKLPTPSTSLIHEREIKCVICLSDEDVIWHCLHGDFAHAMLCKSCGLTDGGKKYMKDTQKCYCNAPVDRFVRLM